MLNSSCVTCTNGYVPRMKKEAVGLCIPCQLRSSPELSQNCSCPNIANEILEPPNEPPICAPRSSLVSWPVGDKANSIDFDSGNTVISQLIRNKLRPSVLLCQVHKNSKPF